MTKKEREAAVERGLKSVQLRPKDESKFRRPPKTLASAGRSFFARQVQEDENKDLPPTPGGRRQVNKRKRERPTSDHQGSEVTPRGRQTPASDRQSQPSPPGQKLRRSPRAKAIPLPTPDPQGQVNFPESESIPLAPLQWRVLTVLRELDGTGEVLSYRDIAERANGKREGVKSAMTVLRTVGAFAEFAIIQTAKTQGVRVRLQPRQSFHQVTQKKSAGITKRDENLPPTPGGRR